MKLLIYVHSPTWYTELSLLGRHLHAQGHDVFFYVVDFGHWTIDKITRELAAQNIPSLVGRAGGPRGDDGGSFALPYASFGGSRTNSIVRATRTWLERLEPAAAAEFRVATNELADAAVEARSLVRNQRADAVILGGDNPGYSTPGIIKGAHDAGVPAIIVPSTMSNGLEEAEVYAGDPRYHADRASTQLTATLFPRWVFKHKQTALLRCPPGRALALETLGLAPPEPWAFNSGFADCIAAESEAMIDYAAEAGLPRGRMIATGSPSDDLMFGVLNDAVRLRRGLYEELKLPGDRPMLLTGLPPDFLYVNGGRPQCDFQDYETLLRAWIDALADQNAFNVVVALHPSIRIETMRHIERPNVRIAARRTSELVPLCDLYVASVSSTIRWAIACGKPVINYDVYRYRYTDFLNIDGVQVTEEHDEFRQSVRRLTGDPAQLEAMKQKLQQVAPRWGFLDGRCTERILHVLADCITSNRQNPANTGASLEIPPGTTG